MLHINRFHYCLIICIIYLFFQRFNFKQVFIWSPPPRNVFCGYNAPIQMFLYIWLFQVHFYFPATAAFFSLRQKPVNQAIVSKGIKKMVRAIYISYTHRIGGKNFIYCLDIYSQEKYYQGLISILYGPKTPRPLLFLYLIFSDLFYNFTWVLFRRFVLLTICNKWRVRWNNVFLSLVTPNSASYTPLLSCFELCLGLMKIFLCFSVYPRWYFTSNFIAHLN